MSTFVVCIGFVYMISLTSAGSIRGSELLLQQLGQWQDELRSEKELALVPENGRAIAEDEAKELVDEKALYKRQSYFTRTQLNALNTDIARLQSYHEDEKQNKVVYSAHLNVAVSYTSNQVYKFDDTVFLKHGGTYGSDGKFTCPRTGKYFVSYSVRANELSETYKNLKAQLMKDSTVINTSEWVCRVNDGDYRSGQYLTATAASNVVVSCNANQKLYVRAGSGGTSKVNAGDLTIFLLDE